MEYVISCLIDDVHENGRKVGDNKNIGDIPPEDQPHLHSPGDAPCHVLWVQEPASKNVLIDK